MGCGKISKIQDTAAVDKPSVSTASNVTADDAEGSYQSQATVTQLRLDRD